MSDVLQGWQPDTYRRHELRYYSGGSATYLVRDGDVEGNDPVDGLESEPVVNVPAPPVIADTPTPASTVPVGYVMPPGYGHPSYGPPDYGPPLPLPYGYGYGPLPAGYGAPMGYGPPPIGYGPPPAGYGPPPFGYGGYPFGNGAPVPDYGGYTPPPAPVDPVGVAPAPLAPPQAPMTTNGRVPAGTNPVVPSAAPVTETMQNDAPTNAGATPPAAITPASSVPMYAIFVYRLPSGPDSPSAPLPQLALVLPSPESPTTDVQPPVAHPLVVQPLIAQQQLAQVPAPSADARQ